jgi:uncharacterized protein (AIM24 family)
MQYFNNAHEIEYKLYGDDMQFVEIELDPGENHPYGFIRL